MAVIVAEPEGGLGKHAVRDHVCVWQHPRHMLLEHILPCFEGE